MPDLPKSTSNLSLLNQLPGSVSQSLIEKNLIAHVLQTHWTLSHSMPFPVVSALLSSHNHFCVCVNFPSLLEILVEIKLLK